MISKNDFSTDSEKLKTMLTEWRDSGAELESVIQNSPGLHEAKQLAPDLKTLGEIGLEAIEFAGTDKTPTAEWRDAKLKSLDEIAKPKAALEFMVVENMKKLVNAAFEKQSAAKN